MPRPRARAVGDRREVATDDLRPAALSGFRLLFSTAARTDARSFWAGMILWLVSSVLYPFFPLAFKVLIDGVTTQRTGVITAAAVAIALLSAGSRASQYYSYMIMWNVWERMTITIDEQLVAVSARLGQVDRIEQPEYIDHLTLLRTNRETFQQSMMSLLSALSLALQVVITIAILASVAPLLLLLPLFSIAPIVASRWAEARSQDALRESAPETRAADSFMMLSVDASAAGELRVLRLRDLVMSRHEAAWNSVVARQWRAETLGAAVSTAALMLFTVGFGGAVLFITVRSVEGAATLGSVILVLTAGQQLHNQIGGVLSSTGDLFRILETMRHFAWIMRYVEKHEERGTVRALSRLTRGIRLDDVSFRYHGASQDAVQNLSLELPAGAVVAVVGENGAGKSTLVKLLCGLMRPTSGRISVEGIDLAEIRGTEWRATLSGAFQDFVRFEGLAQESIGVGDIPRIDNSDDVRAAMARADVSDLEHDLPRGLETPLGREFHEGIDLSGGQWQKVALARSMMRREPLVLALDEPTYSLDVESERRVFEWFSRIARTDNPLGTITIIVSHRFSTVRTADLVAVMHEGRLIECGTHSDLLHRGGSYASMYRMQAEGYL
jgi:ATP-binding cassette, subfamily B, bacterial